MAEYIEREALMKYPIRIDHYDKEHGNKDFVLGIESVLEYAEALPAADVVEVVHGRWVVENEESIRCSECCFNRASIKIPLDYCPNCGARMDGAADKNVGHTIPVNDLYDEDGSEVMTDG